VNNNNIHENKIIIKLKQLPVIKDFLQLLKHLYLPGFEKISLFEVLRFFITGVSNGAITTRASSLAFKFFLAIFPGFIFLITLIPFVPIQNFQTQLLLLLKEILPLTVYEATSETLLDLINNQHNGLLSFGFLFTLYLTTDGMHSVINSFHLSSQIEETRGFLKIRLVALILIFIITLLLVLSITLIVFSDIAFNYIEENTIIPNTFIVYTLIIGKWIITISLFFFAYSFIYWLGPNTQLKFRFISAGSTFATLFSILISLLFAYYINNWGNYNKLYGSIGTVMVVMLWMYFNSIVLLLGFELNASISNAKNKDQHLQAGLLST
jgi:membrane protein